MIAKVDKKSPSWKLPKMEGISLGLILVCLAGLFGNSAHAQNLVLNAGQSRTVPTDFSGTNPGHNRWILRGGTITVNSATYTTTSGTPHRIGQLNTGSLITVNGGTISVPNATVSMGSAGGDGTLTLNGGAISFQTLEVAGNGFGGPAAGTGSVNVNGSAGTFNLNNLSLFDGSDLNFNLDPVGSSPITVANNLNLNLGNVININGAGYTGPAGMIDLITFGTLAGTSGMFDTINIAGFDGFQSATLDSDADSWFLTLIALPPVAPAGSAPTSEAPPTVLVINSGAIQSATLTGLNSMHTTLGNVQNAAQNAVGDLNNRIFNARSGGTQGGNGRIASTIDGTSRYLHFAQNQNIDYRVALGLADGETVEIVDTLSGLGAGAGHPFAMAGIPAITKSVVVAVEGGSGKNSVTDKVVIEETPQTKYEVFSSFDYGYYDQDNLTRNYRGFEVDSYAGSAGFEMRLTDWLVAGTAFTYLESNTNSTANLGNSDLDGEVYSVYATAFHGNTYLDVLYSYGDFNNDISRNTLLGRTAYGETESHSHNIDLNLGHTFHASDNFSFGPSAGLNYTTGEVDGYTERNGGLANLIYPDHDFESMVGRLGGYATFKYNTPAGLLTTQASAGWAHEFNPENGNVTTSLETSPFALVTGNSARSIGGFTASEERAHAGTDWLELGATSRLDIGNSGFNLELGYQGQFFRNNASGHFGSAKIGYEW